MLIGAVSSGMRLSTCAYEYLGRLVLFCTGINLYWSRCSGDWGLGTQPRADTIEARHVISRGSRVEGDERELGAS